MKHLVFFIHMLSFMLGCAAILLSSFAYRKYKSRIVLYYILFLTAWLAVLFERTVYFYTLAIDLQAEDLDFILWVVSSIGCGLMITVLPFMLHDLLQIPMSVRKRVFFLAASLLPVAGFSLYALTPYKLTFVVITSIIVFLFLIYCAQLGLSNFRKVGDPVVRKVAGTFMIVLAAALPYLIVDVRILQNEALHGKFPYGLLSIPVFYLVWNIISIYFGIKFFDSYIDTMNIEQRAYVTENIGKDAVEEGFFGKYKITDREKEVIGLLAKGHSYGRIGEELFISIATVRTHIYNIYQKTDVKNKVELINLMKSSVDGLIQK